MKTIVFWDVTPLELQITPKYIPLKILSTTNSKWATHVSSLESGALFKTVITNTFGWREQDDKENI
jgi:hypothetical protein